jgi:hypothetical protein
MEAIGIVGAAVAIVWLIIWVIQNENVSSIGEQKGLFKMVDHTQEKIRKAKGHASSEDES